MQIRQLKVILLLGIFSVFLSGCAAIAVVDTAVTVTSVAVKTTAKVTGAVVGAAVDGVKAVSGSNKNK